MQEAYKKMQEACGFKSGDKVKILRNAKSYEMGWGDSWSDSMDKNVGKIGVVELIHPHNGFRVVVSPDETTWNYPFFVLERLETFQDSKRRNEVLENIKNEVAQRSVNIDFAITLLKQAKTREEFHDAKRTLLEKVYDIGFLGVNSCIYCPSNGPSSEERPCDSCDYAKAHGICLMYSDKPSDYRNLVKALEEVQDKLARY